jgi:hypothetical protein
LAINIGSNFSYNGKFFLDARQSFDTLEAMHAFPANSIPEGFIAYCKEDQKRYEFKNEEWIEFVAGSVNAGITEEDIVKINTELLKQVDEKLNKYATLEYVDNAIEDVIINEGLNSDCNYFGDEEPENDEQVWFSSSIQSMSSGLEFDNPLIAELFACIRTLQDQVTKLQADVEYLKTNGGGGIPEWPDNPDIPDTPDEPDIVEDGFFLLEDGGFFVLEDDSGHLVLEDYIIIETVKENVLALEDGSMFLLEDGGYILLEEQAIVPPPTQQSNLVLLENGEQMLLENGYNILLEN